LDGREGRLDPRPGTLAFQALDEPRFFAANVCAGAAMEIDIKMKRLAQDLGAQKVGGISLVHGALHDPIAITVLLSQVAISGVGPGRVARQNDAFEHLMRVLLHQDAVVKDARLALLRVDTEIDRPRVVFGKEGPLESARKAGATTAAQT